MKSRLVRNSVMLYGLSLAKIVFPLLTLPYLTRVLSVDVYGEVAYVKSVMQYAQIAVDFGFVLSGTKEIVECRSDARKLGQAVGDILAAKVLLALCAFAVILGLTAVVPILRERRLYTLLSFLPVAVSIFLFDYLFRGIERMEVITGQFLLMKGISTGLTFVFVKNDADILMIPLLDLASSMVAVLFVAGSVKKLGLHILFTNFRNVLKKLSDSAIYFASSMATSVFGAVCTLVIGMYLVKRDVAYWSVSLQMVTAIQALYAPISDGIYPEMIRTKNMALIRKVHLIFMPIVLLGSVFSYFAAPYVVVLIGGAKYGPAAEVFRCLIPVLVLSFSSMVLGWPALGVIGDSKQVTATTVLSAAVQLVGLVVLIQMNCFHLISVAVVRCLTELTLFLSRLIGCMVNIQKKGRN